MKVNREDFLVVQARKREQAKQASKAMMQEMKRQSEETRKEVASRPEFSLDEGTENQDSSEAPSCRPARPPSANSLLGRFAAIEEAMWKNQAQMKTDREDMEIFREGKNQAA
jgi:hypothetical protein